MSRNILIVDDSVTLRAAVSATLTEAGFTVHEATNGREGLDFLEQSERDGLNIELIISDVNMPIMGGFEFVTRVKQTEHKFIPVIMLTTEREETMKQKGRAAGAAGWLVKPFQPAVLVKVVRKFIR